MKPKIEVTKMFEKNNSTPSQVDAIVSQPDHITLWKWFEQVRDYYGYTGTKLKILKQGYYCGFVNLKNVQYIKQKAQKGWICPNDGVIDGINVTFSEHCALCGEKVG